MGLALDAVSALTGIILVLVAVEDVRHFRIPNLAVAGLVGCFALQTVVAGRVGALPGHLLLAGVALAALFAAFTARTIGGGDAKLLTVALLWFGPENAALFAVVLLLTTLVSVAGALVGALPRRVSGGRSSIPFGPPIAAAWIVLLAVEAVVRHRLGAVA